VDDHQETRPLKSKRFTHYLLRRFYGKQGKASPAQALTDARATIEARAMFDGPEKKVFVRVAEHRRGAGGPSHPGPDRRQHHAVLADGHRRLGGPVGYTTFPGEIFRAPRSWVEQAYPNLTYFNEVDRGGHFAAWEEPQLFSEEVRAAFSSLR
jgi:hypothetical protein